MPIQRLRALLAAPETQLALVLALVAAVSGLRLDDDSYQHLARSVVQLRHLDFATWVTDVWNKPLTGLVYGLAGNMGWFPARLVSVACTVGTAHLSALLCQHLLPGEFTPSRRLLLLLFAAQFAVLKDSFVTMTEMPAALCLTWAVFLALVRNRPVSATAVAGLAPLCRVELVPVVAFFTLFVAFAARSRERRSVVQLLCIVVPAGLPFLSWLVAGALVTQDVHWFSRASYAHLRVEWGLPGVLQHNVLTGLVAVASPPLLWALLYGIVSSCRSARQSASGWMRDNGGATALLAGMLVTHYTLLNVLVVYPDDWYGAAYGQAVAAVNARNYTPTSGILTLFAASGVSFWAQATPERGARTLGVCLIFSSLLLVLAKYPRALAELGLSLTLLLAAGAAALFTQALAKFHNRQQRAWQWAVTACLGSALLIRPFFWYPTIVNDHRGAAVEALSVLVQAKQPVRVIQDVASALEFSKGLEVSDCAWSWPHAFPARLATAPVGSLLVVETDALGAALSRYPASIQDWVKDHAQPAAAYRPPVQPSWLTILDRISARNAPVAWSAYWVGE